MKEKEKVKNLTAEEFMKNKRWKVGDKIKDPSEKRVLEILFFFKQNLICRVLSGENNIGFECCEDCCNLIDYTKTSKKFKINQAKNENESVKIMKEGGVQNGDYIVAKGYVFEIFFIGETSVFYRSIINDFTSKSSDEPYDFTPKSFDWIKKEDIKIFKSLEGVIVFLSRENRNLKNEKKEINKDPQPSTQSCPLLEKFPGGFSGFPFYGNSR